MAEFLQGNPCQFIPHTRAKCKPLLLWGKYLYSDTNVGVSKTGTHYFKCAFSGQGCPATAHTKVTEDGEDTYFLEKPNGVEHTCERSPIHLHAVYFALEVYNKCTNLIDARHPKLHSELLTAWRKKLKTDEEKNKFDEVA